MRGWEDRNLSVIPRCLAFVSQGLGGAISRETGRGGEKVPPVAKMDAAHGKLVIYRCWPLMSGPGWMVFQLLHHKQKRDGGTLLSLIWVCETEGQLWKWCARGLIQGISPKLVGAQCRATKLNKAQLRKEENCGSWGICGAVSSMSTGPSWGWQPYEVLPDDSPQFGTWVSSQERASYLSYREQTGARCLGQWWTAWKQGGHSCPPSLPPFQHSLERKKKMSLGTLDIRWWQMYSHMRSLGNGRQTAPVDKGVLHHVELLPECRGPERFSSSARDDTLLSSCPVFVCNQSHYYPLVSEEETEAYHATLL